MTAGTEWLKGPPAMDTGGELLKQSQSALIERSFVVSKAGTVLRGVGKSAGSVSFEVG